MTATEAFSAKVRSIVGPVLADLGFELASADSSVDEGGRRGSVVYYRAPDCKIQVYWSARGGDINCMIGPIAAPDVFGPHDSSGKWHYLNDFIEKPNLPLEELMKVLRSDRINFETDESWLRWLADRIERYFGAAHSGIVELYGS
jgi:hypothetical protein